MRNAPGVSALVCEQLGTSHVEDLPPLIPYACIILPVCCLEMWPYGFLVISHFDKPVLRLVSAPRIRAGTHHHLPRTS